ncbi:MAG: SusD/RagB family nutrient-binding outer membrane lipoprotein, partial [Prevotellaceae bacterium]|nr:SusD/RagB family nutrient-binding outer membrane lipoprotein [Prevotellaceae bacterium]
MKIKYVLGLAMSSLLFLSSCSDSMMDKINTDEQHPSLPAVDGKFQITDGEVATVY